MDGVRVRWTAALTFAACLFWLSLANAAELDCVPKHVPQAEFGDSKRELGSPMNICPGIPRTDEQSCSIMEQGIRYGVSVGWMVNKTITPETYSGKMPFGLKWGESRNESECKILGITRGDPELSKGGNVGFDLSMGTGYCFLTKNGYEYDLELHFDKDRGLSEIVNRILYP